MKKRVEWKVASNGPHGERWWALVDGVARGYVAKIRANRYEAYVGGSPRAYLPTMHAAGRSVVARLNYIYPCQLPR